MPKTTEYPDYENQQITRLIKEYIHSKVDRKILYLRFVDGLSLSEIGSVVGMDKSTVWDHIQKQEKVLFAHMEYKEVDGE